jgi:hypothetical protein
MAGILGLWSRLARDDADGRLPRIASKRIHGPRKRLERRRQTTKYRVISIYLDCNPHQMVSTLLISPQS